VAKPKNPLSSSRRRAHVGALTSIRGCGFMERSKCVDPDTERDSWVRL
jgi:hypothetical protein